LLSGVPSARALVNTDRRQEGGVSKMTPGGMNSQRPVSFDSDAGDPGRAVVVVA
jgi:hypothetical protein